MTLNVLEVTTPETIGNFQDMTLTERRLKVIEDSKVIEISRGSVVSTLKDDLIMRKLSAKWV